MRPGFPFSEIYFPQAGRIAWEEARRAVGEIEPRKTTPKNHPFGLFNSGTTSSRVLTYETRETRYNYDKTAPVPAHG